MADPDELTAYDVRVLRRFYGIAEADVVWNEEMQASVRKLCRLGLLTETVEGRLTSYTVTEAGVARVRVS